MATHDFYKNLAELSISKDINECIKEWKVIYNGTSDSNSDEENRCICNRVIKNYYILINIFNNNYIKIGFGCIKKLNDDNNNKIDTKSTSIKKNIIQLFEEGYYIKIENLNEYAEDILIDYISSKDDKIRYIRDIIDSYKDNRYVYNKIVEILLDAISLIDNKIKYMHDIIDIYKDNTYLYNKIVQILIDYTWKAKIFNIENNIDYYKHNTALYNKIEYILNRKKKI